MLNDRVLPFFEEQDVSLLRILTDRGTEYCGQREHHEYQLYLAVENIDHCRTQDQAPQTNGICERFHRLCRMNSIAWRFARSSILRSSSCRPISIAWLEEYNEASPALGQVLFWENTDADVLRFQATSARKTAGSFSLL